MQYFTETQANCVKIYSEREIYKHKHKFVDFVFNGLFTQKADHLDNKFFIKAVFTPVDSISSKELEFEEFCAGYDIKLDYSDCLL